MAKCSISRYGAIGPHNIWGREQDVGDAQPVFAEFVKLRLPIRSICGGSDISVISIWIDNIKVPFLCVGPASDSTEIP